METNQRKQGIIMSYISLIISISIGLIQVPLYLYFMGSSEWGIYSAMGSILACFSVMDFGLSSTIIRFYTRYQALEDKKNSENILAICSIIYVILAAIAVILGIIFYFFLDGWLSSELTSTEIFEAKQIYIIILINIAFTIPAQLFNAVLNAHEKFVFLKVVLIFQTITQFIVVIAVLSRYHSALALVSVQTFFNLIIIPIRAYYCFKKLHIKIKLHKIPEGLIKSMLSFAFFIFLTALVDQILWRVNPIILIGARGPEENAIYSVAFNIFMNYMLLSTVISSVFLPNVTRMVTKGENLSALSNLFVKVGRVQFLILACVLGGFILFGKQFIDIWTSSKTDATSYMPAYYITLLLIVPFTIDLIQNIGLTILQAQNKIAFRTFVFLGMALVNIILSYKLAEPFGGIGCAFSTGIVFLIGNVFVMNYYYSKRIGLNIKCFWIEISKIAVVAVVCTTLGTLLNKFTFFPSLINLGFKISAYVVIYSLLMWLMAMNEYEKNLIKGITKKLHIFNR